MHSLVGAVASVDRVLLEDVLSRIVAGLVVLFMVAAGCRVRLRLLEQDRRDDPSYRQSPVCRVANAATAKASHPKYSLFPQLR